jgi:signal transduction histidine kinase
VEISNLKSFRLRSSSHELRTRLTAIMGYEELLADDPFVGRTNATGLEDGKA